jgi:hypothetical protein
MKKLTLLVLSAAIALMAGCAGDNPSDPGTGTLDVVTGFAIDWSASDGVDVVMDWTANSDDVDGYYIYWKSDNTGSWVEVGDVTGTTFTHTATAAGTYTVMAYKGTDTSSGYAAEASSMPIVISTEYEIFDNNAPADYFSGFKFGWTGGETGFAATEPFASEKDIYAYEADPISPTGLALYSGDVSPFGGGNHTEMISAEEAGSVSAAPSSGYWVTGNMFADDVIFCALYDGYFAKIIVTDIWGPVGGSTNGTGISFTYEIQPEGREGIRLFTTNQ